MAGEPCDECDGEQGAGDLKQDDAIYPGHERQKRIFKAEAMGPGKFMPRRAECPVNMGEGAPGDNLGRIWRLRPHLAKFGRRFPGAA
jgi:hypothetical protein